MNRGLLEEIRQRPPMYLGDRSLSALQHFLNGYTHALRIHRIAQPGWMLPQDFHDWVAYRLHFKESTSGYRNMLLKRNPSEADALEKFFELLDEYDKREPIEVARVQNYDKQYTRQRVVEGVLQSATTEHFPSTLKLITFTDDPGFFVTSGPLSRPPILFITSLVSKEVRRCQGSDNYIE